MQIDVDSPVSSAGLKRICAVPEMGEARFLDRIP
jgi:hypothetical protein